MPLHQIKYPYLAEGREYLYVPAENQFMQEAKKMAESHGCRKHATGAVAVKNGKIIARGNNAGIFVKVCPRAYKDYKTGEGYNFCHDFCNTVGHAEVTLCHDAENNGVDLTDADMYLYGHWWICQNCWDYVNKAKIKNTYLMKGSETKFNYDFQKDDEIQTPPKLSLYVSGALTHLIDPKTKDLYEEIGKLSESLHINSYVPHLNSDPIKFPDLCVEDIYKMNKEQVAKADLMICYADEPSLGVGQEIEIALNAQTLVILLSTPEQKVARMALGSPNIIDHIIFKNHKDALNQLKPMLKKFIATSKQNNVSVKF